MRRRGDGGGWGLAAGLPDSLGAWGLGLKGLGRMPKVYPRVTKVPPTQVNKNISVEVISLFLVWLCSDTPGRAWGSKEL